MKVRLLAGLRLQNLRHYHIPQHSYPMFINKFRPHQTRYLTMAILSGKLSHF